MTRLQCYWLALLMTNFSAWSQADSVPDYQKLESERLQISTMRQQKTIELELEEQACLSKFAVTDCQNRVGARRRQMLFDLKRREASINALERNLKGADQLRRGEEKAASSAKDQVERTVGPAESAPTDKKKVQEEKNLNHQLQANPDAGRARTNKLPSTLDPKEIEAKQKAYDEKHKALEKRRKDREKRVLDHGVGSPPLPAAP